MSEQDREILQPRRQPGGIFAVGANFGIPAGGLRISLSEDEKVLRGFLWST
jgi:hypothetical protein